MTGYGQAVTTINGFLLQVQARSVNHRYFDTVIRMPLEWQRHERVVKEVFQRLFSRGRIEITVTMELDQHSAASMEMNWSIAENYITVSHQLKERYQLSGMLSLYEILQLPGVVRDHHIPQFEDDRLIDELRRISQLAAEQLLEMRSQEGNHLRTELEALLKSLEHLHVHMLETVPEVNDILYQRLVKRLEELLKDASLDFAPQRLYAEAALLVDRADIQEELTRLGSHLKQAQSLLEDSGPVGRKLDFLSQEMNREANTIGAKAANEQLSSDVVELKSLIEKFREQVQNIQ